MRPQQRKEPLRHRRVFVRTLTGLLLIVAALSACQNRSAPPERPTIAVLPFEAQDAREEMRDLADHLTKRFRTILSTRPEARVIESSSATHFSLAGLDLSGKAAALGADYVLAGTLSQAEGRLRLSLQLASRSGEELWHDGIQSPLLYQAQLQEWALEKLWPQLPLDPRGLEGAMGLVANCHYPDDAMAILTLARTGRRGGGPALLAMVATADIEAGLLHLAQSQFYFEQLETLPESQGPVIEKLALRSLGRAAAACPEHPQVELLRLLYTDELQLHADNADEYLALHPNSADLYLAVAELHEKAGSHRKARASAQEAALLDPLGEATRCRTGALLSESNSGEPDCP
jgi:TolB-like protein